MPQVKYRLIDPRLAPRRTKLEMPGWAGQPEPRTDGSQECVWHCAPFTEGAQYGIEVFWPWEGRTHLFRPGEPTPQILILPLIADFDLVAMDEEEAAEREMRGRRIHASRAMLAEDTTWTSRSATVFDGTYRHLLRATKAREREQ